MPRAPKGQSGRSGLTRGREEGLCANWGGGAARRTRRAPVATGPLASFPCEGEGLIARDNIDAELVGERLRSGERVSPGDEEVEKKMGIDRTYVGNAGSGPRPLAKRIEQILGPLEERRRGCDRRKLSVQRYPDRRGRIRREGSW